MKNLSSHNNKEKCTDGGGEEIKMIKVQKITTKTKKPTTVMVVMIIRNCSTLEYYDVEK
jgi:hypothetical protein